MSTPTDAYPAAAASDVIDTAAGLAPSSALQTARRFRSTVVEATQASHEALLYEPVTGLSTADRLRVAVHCCEAAEAHQLAAHYRALLVQQPAGDASTPTLPAMLTWAGLLTTDPRRGDRAALQALRAAGLADPAIVALAQLVDPVLPDPRGGRFGGHGSGPGQPCAPVTRLNGRWNSGPFARGRLCQVRLIRVRSRDPVEWLHQRDPGLALLALATGCGPGDRLSAGRAGREPSASPSFSLLPDADPPTLDAAPSLSRLQRHQVRAGRSATGRA